MKKIIIALDGDHFPKGAFRFAKFIHMQSEILLAGVFLSPVDYSKLIAYTGIDGVSLMPGLYQPEEEDEVVKTNIHLFEEACQKEGLEYRVHHDENGMALSSLVEETRFADLLLVSSELFYNNISSRQPNLYLEEVLKRSECPIMLLPENFIEPGQVVLAYDGSESSMMAIKQFAYLFPELAKKKTILFSVNAADDLPKYSLVTEWLTRHYPDLQVEHKTMFDKRDFSIWLDEHPLSYVVMGAFSGSIFAHLFKKSMASELIAHHRMPVFISHK